MAPTNSRSSSKPSGLVAPPVRATRVRGRPGRRANASVRPPERRTLRGRRGPRRAPEFEERIGLLSVARRRGLGGERSEFLSAERGAGESPTTLGRLREQDPRATRLSGVARDLRHDLGDLLDELLLALTGQRGGGRDDLNPH